MASEIKVDTVSEKTSANGVTIDGVSIKDSKIATANSIDSDTYVDGSIDAAHMSADSIDSDAYVDGSIDTAHIADNQITLAKMAGGTDGNVISYDASGDPVAIATGSDGEVLTSTGAGSPPAFEAAAGGPSQASQSALEAETNEDTYAPPDLIKHSPGMAKGWISFNGTGTIAILASHNVTSIGDDGSGSWTVTWATDFSGGPYLSQCEKYNFC